MQSTYRHRLLEPILEDRLRELPALLVVGPRAVGKSTTLKRFANSEVSLDVPAEAAAFEADPDAALAHMDEPVLIDEWQNVPTVLGAVRRAVDRVPTPGRFIVTGSVNAVLENETWPGTGRLTRMSMYPMTVREQMGMPRATSFVDRVASGAELEPAADSPDLVGYVELALRGGFPDAALRLSGSARSDWLESHITDLLTHDVGQAEGSGGRRRRDPGRLRRYFEAYALNSAGIADDKTIYEAAGVNRTTADAYESLLEALFVTERIDAWWANNLKRLVQRRKRYVVDPALMVAALRMDANGIIRNGDILGRVIDTFVAAQLRPERVISQSRPRLYHLRTKNNRHEVDILSELAGGDLIAFEVKAGAAPGESDARHLAWLRDQNDDRFVRGVLFHTGPMTFALGDRIVAAPISCLWA